METWRREQFEMAGYESGRRNETVCYQAATWTAEEKAAYAKGFAGGLDSPHARKLRANRLELGEVL